MSRRPPPAGWPPLITSATQPAWMLWRDRALTILMWVVFFIFLETEGELTVAHIRAALHGTRPDKLANWGYFWDQLRPFMIAVAALVGWLCLFGLLTIRRRNRTRLHRAPDPLELDAEMQRGGMERDALIAAQHMHRAVAHLDAQGHYRIEVPPG
jgi:hypothetical protein